MTIRRVVSLVFGSWVVSLACASPAPHDTDRSPGYRALDAVVDAIEDAIGIDTAVADARADDAGPAFSVDEVPCLTKIARGGGLGTYAEKAYPGRSAADLARAAILVCGEGISPDGYACRQAIGFVRDGSIAVTCDPAGTARIVLPR